jgi:hypothetical protein
LNSSTFTPPVRSRSKKAGGVWLDPTLFGVHVIARGGDRLEHRPVRVRTVDQQPGIVADRERCARDFFLDCDMPCEEVRAAAFCLQALDDRRGPSGSEWAAGADDRRRLGRVG